MKRTLSSFIIAGVLVSSVPFIIPMNVVNAAQVSQDTKMKASTQYIFVDGTTQKIASLQVNGNTLYSVKEIARYTQATFTYDTKSKTYTLAGNGQTVTFKRQSTEITSNNAKMELAAPVTIFNNQTYIDLEPLVLALGGDVVKNEVTGTKFIVSKGLVSGSFSNAKWLNGSQILFMSEDENAYVFNVKTKNVIKQFTVLEMVSSPDGKQAVYTDDTGFVYLLDFETGKTTQISSDESFKAEFKWSTDGTKLFFLQGDKNETISSMSVKDGSITKILDDKVEYKSDLVISVDGSKVLYTAAKQAVTKYTDDANSDVETIVTEGTEPQIYSVDATVQGSKPVAISSSKENKFFTTLLPNGNVLYLSVDVEDEEKLPELKMIQSEGQVTSTLVSAMQIESVSMTKKGNVYLLVTEEDESSSIYKLDVSTKKLERKLNTQEAVTGFDISLDEKQMVVMVSTENGEKLTVLKNGSLEALTKTN
jgi:WD40 repeat protein